MLAGDELVGAGARAECVGQDHLQVAAVDRELRVLVSGGAAERLLVDQLAEAVEEGGIGGGDRGLGERGFKAERGELSRSMRKQVDADADRPDLRGGFENPARNSFLMQREPERQPANAGTDDDDLVAHLSSGHAFQDRFRRRIQ